MASLTLPLKKANLTVNFGDIVIPLSQTFLMKKHVYGLVNLKPASPGHVLVCIKRSAKRLYELTEVETLELWSTVKIIAKKIEEYYGRSINSII